MFKNFMIATLLIALLASCGSKSKEDQATKDSTAKPLQITQIVGVALIEPQSHIVSLYSEVGGIVKRINHDINEEVKAGDVIVELISDVEQAQLTQAQSKLATQQALINATQSQSNSIRFKSENAKANYDRNTNLFQSGGITKQALDDSRFTYESLQADLASALANIKQQQSRLNEMAADINYYQKLVDRKKVKALVDGKILSMDVKIGSNISSNQSVCDFAPDGPLMAVTEVDELFADKVKVGMSTYIRPQGKTDTVGTGKVVLTSPYLKKKSLFSDGAANMEDRRVREVRVLLDSGEKVLIGSRVEAVISLQQ
ncbi:MAG TPA: HlyD family efflux transporter periplasmic adaptor subunit [Cytophagaceae bacterium]|nr:HlyD family efflux transporter periplasmic adaptor subunit [Cytophagaceae bacterium]